MQKHIFHSTRAPKSGTHLTRPGHQHRLNSSLSCFFFLITSMTTKDFNCCLLNYGAVDFLKSLKNFKCPPTISFLPSPSVISVRQRLVPVLKRSQVLAHCPTSAPPGQQSRACQELIQPAACYNRQRHNIMLCQYLLLYNP